MEEEGILKHLQGCSARVPAAPGALAVRAESRTITKLKPKIRIVHIVAPEVIQTDAANFRDLVQRLTGKHARRGAVDGGGGGGRKRAAAKAGVDVKPGVVPAAHGLCVDVAAVMGSLGGFSTESPSADFFEERVLKLEVVETDEGLWTSNNNPPGAAFFGGLSAELDGFMQGLQGELPLIPLSAVDLFGEETPSASESDRSVGS